MATTRLEASLDIIVNMLRYPAHLTDKLRVNIALEVTKKEIRKYYPSLNQAEMKKLESDVDRCADFSTDISICNFWDTIYAYNFEMIRKEWVNYLTAENVSWSVKPIATDHLLLEWPELGDPKLREIGRPPYSARRIRDWLEQNPSFRSRQLQNSDLRSRGSLDRDTYPIVAIEKKGTPVVEDGNRRVLRAILYDKPQLNTYIGRAEDDTIKNYWIATGVMRQLVLAAERAGAERNTHTFDVYKQVLESLFAQSSVARITFEIRVAARYFGQRNPLAARFIDSI